MEFMKCRRTTLGGLNKTLKFLDLFAGIGGFRLGMGQTGHECVGHVEWDKFARKSYKAIHRPKEDEFDREDITKITDEEWRTLRGKVDCICAGFPCQSFSIAGRRRGFEDARGTMFFEVARATKQIQPRFLLLENVRGLLSHDKGQTFTTILSAQDELGYDAEWKLLNSKDFGVPQNRERVFIVGYPRGRSGREILSFGENDEVFNWAEQPNKPQPQTQLCTTINTKMGSRADDTFVIESTILQIGRGKNKGGIHAISPTVTSNNFHSNNLLISEEKQVRKLTPRECFRLQGFPDWAFDRAKEAGLSDSQLYKQAGNSVTVNVVYEIARKMKEEKQNI